MLFYFVQREVGNWKQFISAIRNGLRNYIYQNLSSYFGIKILFPLSQYLPNLVFSPCLGGGNRNELKKKI